MQYQALINVKITFSFFFLFSFKVKTGAESTTNKTLSIKWDTQTELMECQCAANSICSNGVSLS